MSLVLFPSKGTTLTASTFVWYCFQAKVLAVRVVAVTKIPISKGLGDFKEAVFIGLPLEEIANLVKDLSLMI